MHGEKKKMEAEIRLGSIAKSINKYHSKIMNNPTATQLNGKLSD